MCIDGVLCSLQGPSVVIMSTRQTCRSSVESCRLFEFLLYHSCLLQYEHLNNELVRPGHECRLNNSWVVWPKPFVPKPFIDVAKDNSWVV